MASKGRTIVQLQDFFESLNKEYEFEVARRQADDRSDDTTAVLGDKEIPFAFNDKSSESDSDSDSEDTDGPEDESKANGKSGEAKETKTKTPKPSLANFRQPSKVLSLKAFWEKTADDDKTTAQKQAEVLAGKGQKPSEAANAEPEVPNGTDTAAKDPIATATSATPAEKVQEKIPEKVPEKAPTPQPAPEKAPEKVPTPQPAPEQVVEKVPPKPRDPSPAPVVAAPTTATPPPTQAPTPPVYASPTSAAARPAAGAVKRWPSVNPAPGLSSPITVPGDKRTLIGSKSTYGAASSPQLNISTKPKESTTPPPTPKTPEPAVVAPVATPVTAKANPTEQRSPSPPPAQPLPSVSVVETAEHASVAGQSAVATEQVNGAADKAHTKADEPASAAVAEPATSDSAPGAGQDATAPTTSSDSTKEVTTSITISTSSDSAPEPKPTPVETPATTSTPVAPQPAPTEAGMVSPQKARRSVSRQAHSDLDAGSMSSDEHETKRSKRGSAKRIKDSKDSGERQPITITNKKESIDASTDASSSVLESSHVEDSSASTRSTKKKSSRDKDKHKDKVKDKDIRKSSRNSSTNPKKKKSPADATTTRKKKSTHKKSTAPVATADAKSPDDESKAALSAAAQLATATDKGQELDKLKQFFANWQSKDLMHTWEIDPTEMEFIERVGEGTSCSVYRGMYRGQEVALKVLKDINQKQLTNFTKEFDIISKFRSPYVVFFFGACILPVPVMVLGYCPKGSLFNVLNNQAEEVTWPVVLKVAIQTLRGLESLHNWKPPIVHRDLKSRNILVLEDWQTKLCDFGESRYTTGTNLETLCKVRGTYAYIGPEVYFGQSFTAKSDVYAFGVILWELCNRCVKKNYESPFSEYKSLIYDFQIIVQASRKGLRPTIHKDVPMAIANAIRRCWDHEPANRPDSTQLLRFFDEISAEPNQKKWVEAKTYPTVHWPPPEGPGKAGAPPKTGGAAVEKPPN